MSRRKYLTPNIDPSGISVWRCFFIPRHLLFLFSGAVQELCHSYNWQKFGTYEPDTIAQLFTEILSEPMDNPLLGTIIAYITNDPPVGVLPLDGGTYSVDDYPSLAGALHPSLVSGGSFTLPDARGRFLRAESGDFLATGGSDTHTLTIDEIPSHTHTYTPPVANIDIEAPGAPDIFAAGLGLPIETAASGSGLAHNNVPSFLAVRYGVVHD